MSLWVSKALRLVNGIACLCTLSAFAQADEPKVIDGYVGSQVRIIDITDISLIDQQIKSELVGSSMVVEVKGIYEAFGEGQTLFTKLTRVDDRNPINYEQYIADLHSVYETKEPMPIGIRFMQALSRERPFRLKMRVDVNGWGGRQESAQWDINFKFPAFDPIYHEKTKGFQAILTTRSGRPEWLLRKVGL